MPREGVLVANHIPHQYKILPCLGRLFMIESLRNCIIYIYLYIIFKIELRQYASREALKGGLVLFRTQDN